MNDNPNITGLTRQEVEQYKNLRIESQKYWLRETFVYPLLLNLEFVYLTYCTQNVSSSPECESADKTLLGIAGALLFGTALNFALEIIDHIRIMKDIKTLEQKITK